jgi:hypothetical protein
MRPPFVPLDWSSSKPLADVVEVWIGVLVESGRKADVAAWVERALGSLVLAGVEQAREESKRRKAAFNAQNLRSAALEGEGLVHYCTALLDSRLDLQLCPPTARSCSAITF